MHGTGFEQPLCSVPLCCVLFHAILFPCCWTDVLFCPNLLCSVPFCSVLSRVFASLFFSILVIFPSVPFSSVLLRFLTMFSHADIDQGIASWRLHSDMPISVSKWSLLRRIWRFASSSSNWFIQPYSLQRWQLLGNTLSSSIYSSIHICFHDKKHECDNSLSKCSQCR